MAYPMSVLVKPDKRNSRNGSLSNSRSRKTCQGAQGRSERLLFFNSMIPRWRRSRSVGRRDVRGASLVSKISRRGEEAINRRIGYVRPVDVGVVESPKVSILRWRLFTVRDHMRVAFDVVTVRHLVNLLRLQVVNILRPAAGRLNPSRNRGTIRPLIMSGS